MPRPMTARFSEFDENLRVCRWYSILTNFNEPLKLARWHAPQHLVESCPHHKQTFEATQSFHDVPPNLRAKQRRHRMASNRDETQTEHACASVSWFWAVMGWRRDSDPTFGGKIEDRIGTPVLCKDVCNRQQSTKARQVQKIGHS